MASFFSLKDTEAAGEYEMQEFRSSGVQEFRSSGVQEFRSSGVQEFRSSGVQEKMNFIKFDSKLFY